MGSKDTSPGRRAGFLGLQLEGRWPGVETRPGTAKLWDHQKATKGSRNVALRKDAYSKRTNPEAVNQGQGMSVNPVFGMFFVEHEIYKSPWWPPGCTLPQQ